MGNRVEKVEHQALDTAAVVERISEIYDGVFQYYEMMAATEGLNGRLTGLKPPAVRYCTHDWNDWLTQVTTYDAEHVADGDMGFMEADYWIMGQDWGDLAVSDVHVISMTDTTATVELNLHNLGSVTAVRLDLCQEKGSWMIDNFIDVTHDMDWKANMKEYLASKKANQ